jgi:hypothetical protein
MKRTRPYYIWNGMIARCTSPEASKLPRLWRTRDQGGAQWAAKPGGFIAFWRDLGLTYQPGLTIERKDVNGDYQLQNCRCATAAEQQLNRRNARIVDTPQGPVNITTAARLRV